MAFNVESLPLSLENGFSNFDPSFAQAKCSRLRPNTGSAGNTIVLLSGVLTRGAPPTLGSKIATLPPGFRPSDRQVFSVYCGTNAGFGMARVDGLQSTAIALT